MSEDNWYIGQDSDQALPDCGCRALTLRMSNLHGYTRSDSPNLLISKMKSILYADEMGKVSTDWIFCFQTLISRMFLMEISE
jgi:hypothetical protein